MYTCQRFDCRFAWPLVTICFVAFLGSGHICELFFQRFMALITVCGLAFRHKELISHPLDKGMRGFDDRLPLELLP